MANQTNNNALIVALAKVLIAAAWADGELHPEEINVMKDLLFRLTRLNSRGGMQYTAVEWAQIEMYIEASVPPAERARLIQDLRAQIKTQADKDLVFQALEELASADGEVSPEDKAVIQEIREAIDGGGDDNGFFGGLSRLFGGSRQRRETALTNAPNREQYLDDFLNNKVYYGVRRRLDLGKQDAIDLPEEQMRRLAALGGVMARIAHVDLNVTDQEFDAMVEALQANWDLSPAEATFVAEVAVSEVAPTMDTVRLVRDVSSSVPPERADALLDILFAVAAADGYVTDAEMDAIYSIARSLGLSHRTFIDAKLRIPADQREG